MLKNCVIHRRVVCFTEGFREHGKLPCFLDQFRSFRVNFCTQPFSSKALGRILLTGSLFVVSKKYCQKMDVKGAIQKGRLKPIPNGYSVRPPIWMVKRWFFVHSFLDVQNRHPRDMQNGQLFLDIPKRHPMVIINRSQINNPNSTIYRQVSVDQHSKESQNKEQARTTQHTSFA